MSRSYFHPIVTVLSFTTAPEQPAEIFHRGYSINILVDCTEDAQRLEFLGREGSH